MINDNNIEIDGIGLVHFTRSRRARRIIISVSPAKGVRVAIPSRSSLQKALEFVQVKKNGSKNIWRLLRKLTGASKLREFICKPSIRPMRRIKSSPACIISPANMVLNTAVSPSETKKRVGAVAHPQTTSVLTSNWCYCRRSSWIT